VDSPHNIQPFYEKEEEEVVVDVVVNVVVCKLSKSM
jgi:hypothetical protein